MNKCLAALTMSTMCSKTFKAHETEVGNIAEDMAIVSCTRATEQKRKPSIENVEKLKQLL